MLRARVCAVLSLSFLVSSSANDLSASINMRATRSRAFSRSSLLKLAKPSEEEAATLRVLDVECIFDSCFWFLLFCVLDIRFELETDLEGAVNAMEGDVLGAEGMACSLVSPFRE